MARGWESKGVEAQQEEAEERRKQAAAPPPDPAVLERERKRESLQLTRTRVLGDLQRACHPRHRGQLEAALAHIDQQLAEL